MSSPIYGKYVNLIHPFDFFVLIENKKGLVKEIGETGIPVNTPEGCYLSHAPIFEVDNNIYIKTATVKPVTDRFK